jgi:hypothetical protein
MGHIWIARRIKQVFKTKKERGTPFNGHPYNKIFNGRLAALAHH